MEKEGGEKEETGKDRCSERHGAGWGHGAGRPAQSEGAGAGKLQEAILVASLSTLRTDQNSLGAGVGWAGGGHQKSQPHLTSSPAPARQPRFWTRAREAAPAPGLGRFLRSSQASPPRRGARAEERVAR